MTSIFTRRQIAGLAAASFLAVLAACKPSQTEITYAGATTQIPALAEAAPIFEALHPGTRIAISGGGSTTGIRSVASGRSDLGGAARDLTSEEAAQVISIPWARDGIAVVAGRDVPLTGITLGELQRLYASKTAIEGMTRIAKSWVHGTAQSFASGVGLAEAEVHSEAVAGSNGEVLAMVASIPDAIGYVSASDAAAAVAAGAPLHILAVEGVTPSLETLADGSYPLARTLWLLLPRPVPGRTQPEAGEFAAFLTGPETAAILRRLGFLPIE